MEKDDMWKFLLVQDDCGLIENFDDLDKLKKYKNEWEKKWKEKSFVYKFEKVL